MLPAAAGMRYSHGEGLYLRGTHMCGSVHDGSMAQHCMYVTMPRSNLKGADDAFAYGSVMNSGVYESGTDSQTNPLYRVTD